MAGAAGGDVGASRLRVDGTEAGAQACRRTGTTGARWPRGRDAALVDGLRGRGAGCAGRTRAGGQPDAGTRRRNGSRRRAPCRVPARPRPCRRSACTAPPSASRLSGPHGANSCPAPKPGRANCRWRRKNGPSAITRPVSTPAGNSTCSAASPPPRTRAREPGAAETDLRAARVSVAAEAVRLHRTARRAAAPSGAVRPAGRPAPSARPGAGAQTRGIASDFDVDRASVLEAETAAQLPLSAQLARQHAQRLAVLTGESQIAPGLLASAGQPCRAASRPRRCRPISCASGRTSVARNSRCCRPRPNYGCRSPSYTRA